MTDHFFLAALHLWATNRMRAFQVQIAMNQSQKKSLFSCLVVHHQTMILRLAAIDFVADLVVAAVDLGDQTLVVNIASKVHVG